MDRKDRQLLTDTDHDIAKSISSRWLTEGFWAIAGLDGSAPDRLSPAEIEQETAIILGMSDEALLSHHRETAAKSRSFENSGHWLFRAFFTGEQTLARFQHNDTVKAEVLMAMSDSYYARARHVLSHGVEHSQMLLEYAVRLREIALKIPQFREATVRVPELRKLAEIHSERLFRGGLEEPLKVTNMAAACFEEAAGLMAEEEGGRLRAASRALRFKGGDIGAIDCALEISIDQIMERPVSMDSVPPRRFRFIDCESFCNKGTLRILELPDLPESYYVAISYVWQGGLRADASPNPGPVMKIKNTANADPISIDVLRITCNAALTLNCPLIWLDGVCIMQGNDNDKDWQIQNMFNVYSLCKTCLIIPGGLSRLVAIDEETRWVHRAWTLQEAIAPPSCHCLFSWPHGDCVLQTVSFAGVHEVEPGRAAISEMRSLLNITHKNCDILQGRPRDNLGKVTIRLLGNEIEDKDSVSLNALIGALDRKGREGMGNAVWRAALTRFSSRPVDFALSIMGIFGITLDPSRFAPDDKIGATVALMQAMIVEGQRPEWLGIMETLRPGHHLTMIPEFPQPDVDGRAAFGNPLWSSNWWIKGIPPGLRMDDAGYLHISASCLPIQSVRPGSGDVIFENTDGQWALSLNNSPQIYAVHLGEKCLYTAIKFPPQVILDKYLILLAEKSKEGKFHCLGYASVEEKVINLESWESLTLVIR
jgi:hypothetical protein